MGSGSVISMDDRGRILIPRNIRKKVKTKLFTIELMNDGSIILKPILSDVLELAGKFKGLLRYESIEELEEKQEEYVKSKRGI